MGNIFLSLYDFFAKRRGLLYALVVCAFAGTTYLASRLRLEEDIAKALPADAKTARFGDALRNSKFLEKIIVTISQTDTSAAPNPERLIETCETFVALADSALKPYIASIQYKADDDAALQLLDFQLEYLPVFLDTSDYAAIDRL
ncbi:MAG: hypothetical protein L6Q97_04335, partial [Thermoanaerobaculia bacterium]|nr:hypothetical protein [Thermoanaerobaculia bacterium]